MFGSKSSLVSLSHDDRLDIVVSDLAYEQLSVIDTRVWCTKFGADLHCYERKKNFSNQS
jgi:hypothetical protein